MNSTDTNLETDFQESDVPSRLPTELEPLYLEVKRQIKAVDQLGNQIADSKGKAYLELFALLSMLFISDKYKQRRFLTKILDLVLWAVIVLLIIPTLVITLSFRLWLVLFLISIVIWGILSDDDFLSILAPTKLVLFLKKHLGFIYDRLNGNYLLTAIFLWTFFIIPHMYPEDQLSQALGNLEFLARYSSAGVSRLTPAVIPATFFFGLLAVMSNRLILAKLAGLGRKRRWRLMQANLDPLEREFIDKMDDLRQKVRRLAWELNQRGMVLRLT